MAKLQIGRVFGLMFNAFPIPQQEALLPRGRIIPRRGETRVTFGEPMRLQGEDPRVLAHQAEETVHAL